MIDIRDHLGRSLLLVAVGPGYYSFAECLLHAGFDPNCKEHCGAIPLSLAVIKNNPKMCELFVRSDANARGPLYVEIPSPYDMARKLKNAELLKVLNPDESDEEDNFFSNYDSALFRDSVQKKVCDEQDDDTKCAINRSSKGFLTGVIGDVGTCKTNRGVMERSASLGWATVIPGDLHMKGSLAECCYKEHGRNGLLVITEKS